MNPLTRKFDNSASLWYNAIRKEYALPVGTSGLKILVLYDYSFVNP
jgi:hypothetical protein